MTGSGSADAAALTHTRKRKDLLEVTTSSSEKRRKHSMNKPADISQGLPPINDFSLGITRTSYNNNMSDSVENLPAAVASGVKAKNQPLTKPSVRHRSACHRCGNIRKNFTYCSRCPNVYCNPCVVMMISEYGENVFTDGW